MVPEDRTTLDAVAAALVDPLYEMQRGHYFGDSDRSNAQGWAEYVAACVLAAVERERDEARDKLEVSILLRALELSELRSQLADTQGQLAEEREQVARLRGVVQAVETLADSFAERAEYTQPFTAAAFRTAALVTKRALAAADGLPVPTHTPADLAAEHVAECYVKLPTGQGYQKLPPTTNEEQQ